MYEVPAHAFPLFLVQSTMQFFVWSKSALPLYQALAVLDVGRLRGHDKDVYFKTDTKQLMVSMDLYDKEMHCEDKYFIKHANVPIPVRRSISPSAPPSVLTFTRYVFCVQLT